MSAALVTVAVILLFTLAVLFVRIPVGLLPAVLGFAGYAVLDGFANARTMVGNEVWATFSSAGLTVIPLFVLMGQIAFHSGLCSRLYAAMAAWTGHRPGGIAAATLLACGGFSAICGSNTATAATMSVVALPEMKKYGYEPIFAASTVAVGTTLGAIIPPSVVAVVLSVQTGLSARKLFIGGILPGIVLLGLFIVTTALCARFRPGWAPAGERRGARERLRNLPGLLEALVLFALVVGGMAAGLFTPTEAGAAGSVLAVLVGLCRGSLGLKACVAAVRDTMRVSAMIFLLLAGANIFGKFIVISRVPFALSESAVFTSLPAPAVLVLVLVFFLIGGMFMDALALLLITLPVFSPLISGLGYNPLWFCLVLMVVTTMGAVTPPVGASAFVTAALGRVPLQPLFGRVLLFMPAFLVCLALMILFPNLTLWLPEWVG